MVCLHAQCILQNSFSDKNFRIDRRSSRPVIYFPRNPSVKYSISCCTMPRQIFSFNQYP
jgi:hypothetical protein